MKARPRSRRETFLFVREKSKEKAPIILLNLSHRFSTTNYRAKHMKHPHPQPPSPLLGRLIFSWPTPQPPSYTYPMTSSAAINAMFSRLGVSIASNRPKNHVKCRGGEFLETSCRQMDAHHGKLSNKCL